MCVKTQIRRDFTNHLAIITRTKYISDIMVDGNPVPVPWATASDWGFSYVAFPVTHDVHFVTIKPGSSAKYGAYVYGHSLVDTSSSAYGYAIGFHGMLPSQTRYLEHFSKVKQSSNVQQFIFLQKQEAQ